MSITLSRTAVGRLTKERADVEKALAAERERFARLQSEVGRLAREISASSSASSVQYKLRQAESKQTDLAKTQKKIADLSVKSAAKLEELNKTLQNLERAENAAGKKRRDEEIVHAKTVTREMERQANLQTHLRRSPFVIDVAQLPHRIKVLFLAANPLDLDQLRLDEEIREITEKIRLSEYRDSVELISRWAVRPPDLLQALNEHRPHVVHFSGHGAASGEIFVENPTGGSKPVTINAMAATLGTVAENVRVVLFNACFSGAGAEAVTEHIEIAIGMDTAVGDEAARIFAAQFYSSIGFGHSVSAAFNQARAALLVHGIPEDNTPRLFSRADIDPNEVILVRPT